MNDDEPPLFVRSPLWGGVLFHACGLAYVFATAAAGRWLAGPEGMRAALLGGAFTLASGWVVFALAARYSVADSSPLFLLAMLPRLFLAGGGFLAVRLTRPELPFRSLAGWTVCAYCLALFVEVWWVTRHIAWQEATAAAEASEPPAAEPETS